MSRRRDTDTLTPTRRTRRDPLPDAQTVKSFTGDEAETHKIDPRAFAPLRVCPQCSLAWEIAGEWCPSCGTAFDKSAREQSSATRVMPARQLSARSQSGQPPLPRSARRRAASPPTAPPTRSAKSGGAGKIVLMILLVAGAATLAFFAGQATRPSEAQNDKNISSAVQAARQSAANSYARAFAKFKKQTADAIAAARRKALAEGQAKAQADQLAQQRDQQSIFDSVTGCVLRGQC
jgi:hypothetical protein